MNHKILIIFTSALIIAHSTEEYFTSFQTPDAVFIAMHNVLAPQLDNDLFFIIFQILSDIIFIAMLVILTQKKKEMWGAWLMSALMLIELHHIFEAIMRQTYHPGLVTALLYPLYTLAWWLHARHPPRRKVTLSDSSSRAR